MGNWYVPSQAVRKEHAGTRCPGCSLYMHHKDMVAWAGSEGTVYLHDACAEILLTQEPETDVIHNVEPAGTDEQAHPNLEPEPRGVWAPPGWPR